MDIELILAFSITLQVIAAAHALYLIRITGRRRAWLFIALAVSLMAARRIVSLMQIRSHTESDAFIQTAEWIALASSLLILIGISSIGPYLREVNQLHLARETQINRHLSQLNACFLSFGSNPNQNIERLTRLLGETLGATYALYNQMDDGVLCTRAGWHAPPNYQPADKPEGHLCFDVIRAGHKRSLIVRQLQSSPYAATDPNVRALGLQTYIGQAVMCQDEAIGSLCLAFQRDFEPGTSDREFLEIVAQALGIEEERLQAEQARRDSEARYHRMTENAPDIIYRCRLQPERHVEYINPAVEAITGYTPEEYYANPDLITKIVHPGDHPLIEQIMQGQDVATPVEMRWIRKDGEIIWTEQHNVPVYDQDGTLVAVEGIARNVTERHRLEENLRFQAYLLTIVEQAVIATDLDGTITYWNHFAEQLYGWAASEVIGRDIMDILKTETSHEHTVQIIQQLIHGQSWSGEFVVHHRSGNPFPIQITNTPIWNETTGKVMGLVGISHDISFRKEAEAFLLSTHTLLEQRVVERTAELQAVNARLRLFEAIIEQSQEALLVSLPNGEPIFTNAACDALFGISLQQEPASRYWRCLAPESRSTFETEILPSLQRGTGWEGELDIITANGQRVPIWERSDALLDDRGKIVYMFGFMHDISSRRKLEAQLKRRLRQQTAIAELGQLALTPIDGQTLFEVVAQRVTVELEVEFSKVLELDGQHLRLRAGTGWQEEIIDQTEFSSDTQAAYTIQVSEPVILTDLATETRFTNTALLRAHQIASGISVVIGSTARPFGVLCVHSIQNCTFSEDDITFLQVTANILAAHIEHTRIETAVRTSEEKFRSVIQQSEDGIVLVDAEGTIIEWNEGQEQITGLTRGEVINRPLWEVQYGLGVDEERRPDSYAIDKARITDLLESREAPWLNQLVERLLQRPDGTRRIVQSMAFPIHLEQGFLLGSISRDVTERRQSEEALRFTQFTVDHAPDGVFWMDAEGHYIYANETAAQLTGYSRQELLSKTLFDIAPGFVPMMRANSPGGLKQRRTITTEVDFHTKDGRRVPVEVTSNYLEFNGRAYSCGFIRDITARKQSELALRASEAIKSAILVAIPDLIFRLSRNGEYLGVYTSDDDLLAVPRDSLLGHTLYDTLPPDVAQQAQESVRRVFETGETQVIEYRLEVPAGFRYFEARFAYNDLGEVLAIVRNITERKLAEQALERQRAFLHQIIDANPNLIFVKDREGRYTLANQAMANSHNMTVAAIIGKTDREINPMQEEVDRYLALDEEVKRTRAMVFSPAEHMTQPHTGETRWYQNIKVPLFGPDGEVVQVLGVATDITELKEAQEGLETQRAFLRQIIDANPNIIFVKDREGRYTMANQAMATLFGTTVDAIIGSRDSDFNPYKDQVHGYREADEMVIKTKQPLFIPEDPAIDAQTGKVRWHQTTKLPLLTPDGNANHILGVATDITARKEAEQRMLELALEKERSQLLGDFILATTHEFGNPISVMKTSLYMMGRTELESAQERMLDMLTRQVGHIERLVEGLLTMSRLDREEKFWIETIDPKPVLRMVHDYIKEHAAAKQHHLIFDLEDDLPPVAIDQNQVFRALSNVVENAIAYTSEGGTVVLRATHTSEHLIVEVQDSGPGIAANDLDRVFARFYRVDEARSERGAGLGLPIAKKIIERHRGRIEVESVPDQGSTFRVFLPITAP